jgi:undecaprenyl phosphate N,N'-diacetylbacillosamine 1-phosphate transferase
MYKKWIKPLLDFLFAFIALIILSPLFIVISIAILLESGGDIYFLQERLGKHGKIFKIIKFRSMIKSKDNFAFSKPLQENDHRITKIGRFIRKTSLDEIPQLINILKGDMSFIGPRPPIFNYPKKYEEYSVFEKQRFYVKPGLSGLAAIRAREINDWNINIPIDVEYVQKISFILDVKLFALSLCVFFKTDNIYTKIKK